MINNTKGIDIRVSRPLQWNTEIELVSVVSPYDKYYVNYFNIESPKRVIPRAREESRRFESLRLTVRALASRRYK